VVVATSDEAVNTMLIEYIDAVIQDGLASGLNYLFEAVKENA
jgi:hypothetical protein